MKAPSRRDRHRIQAKKGCQKERDDEKCLARIKREGEPIVKLMKRANRREAARYDNPLRHPKQRKAAFWDAIRARAQG